MMPHPFIDPQSYDDLTVDQLTNKISDLNRKLNMAHQMQNGALISQIRLALTSVKSVYESKINEQYKKLNLQNKININDSIKPTNTFIDTEPGIPNLPKHLT